MGIDEKFFCTETSHHSIAYFIEVLSSVGRFVFAQPSCSAILSIGYS